MNDTPAISSFPARKLPLAGSFFPPAGLSDLPLVHALSLISSDLSASEFLPVPFNRRNARFLFRSVRILSSLFDFLSDSSSNSLLTLPSAANTSFRELYVLLHRAKLILDYCSHSSKLWLLVNIPRVSAHFHDLLQEISTLLDVLPLSDLSLDEDLLEQLELLHRQSRRSLIYLDPREEALHLKISSFLENFAKGQAPDLSDLRETFVRQLGILDARSLKAEIESLEERIYSQDEDLDPGIIYGVVALARYARFSLFAFGEETRGERKKSAHLRKSSSCISQMVPKDFCCPISLDLMRDPVIVSTGQTYDRSSISQWLDEGHRTCPNSGQALTHTRLVPNRALRNLISQWCAVNDVPYDAPAGDGSAESSVARAITRAAAAANRATARILVRRLTDGSELAKAESAKEIRILAKAGKENRLCVGEEGAIPALKRLLRSMQSELQVDAVTALLNLSLLDSNKARIVQEAGCLRAVVEVCRTGLTAEARENAAAVLFSLSAVHEYKVLIAGEEGALEALAALLARGTTGGKKDAVAALYNISTHGETGSRMVESGAAAALVAALGVELVAEEASGAMALLARRQAGAEALGSEQRAVSGLVGLMRRGSPRAKENAVAALLEICRFGGAGAAERVARTPALGGLLQTILFTGTKRAKRKANSLARVCRRSVASSITGGSTSPSATRHGAEFSAVVDSTTIVRAM